MEFFEWFDKKLSLLSHTICLAGCRLFGVEKMSDVSNSHFLKGFIGLVIASTIFLTTQVFAQFFNPRLLHNAFNWLEISSRSPIIKFYLFDLHVQLFFDLLTFVTTVFIFYVCQSNREHINSTNEQLETQLLEWKQNANSKMERDEEVRDQVSVSVLIAARNEERNIANCVRSLMNQNYSNYEILVMNDDSTDGTEQELNKLKLVYQDIPVSDEYEEASAQKDEQGNRSDARFKCYTNKHLPANWYGKSWSIHSLAKKAKGEILIITDADTTHNRDLVRFCVLGLEIRKVDFLSGNFVPIDLS